VPAVLDTTGRSLWWILRVAPYGAGVGAASSAAALIPALNRRGAGGAGRVVAEDAGGGVPDQLRCATCSSARSHARSDAGWGGLGSTCLSGPAGRLSKSESPALSAGGWSRGGRETNRGRLNRGSAIWSLCMLTYNQSWPRREAREALNPAPHARGARRGRAGPRLAAPRPRLGHREGQPLPA
jgi:hypothetical protein